MRAPNEIRVNVTAEVTVTVNGTGGKRPVRDAEAPPDRSWVTTEFEWRYLDGVS